MMKINYLFFFTIIIFISIAGCSENPNQKLITAAEKGDIYGVKDALTESGAKVNAQIDFNGTALHMSAEGGHEKVFNYLISKGADINAKIIKGSGAPVIVTATSYGKINIVKILINKKADLNATGKNGSTALDFAIAQKNQKMITLLKSAGGISKNP
jgi:ankyrin repeat protein